MTKFNKNRIFKNSFIIFLITIGMSISFSNYFKINCEASDYIAGESEAIAEVFSSNLVTGLSNFVNFFGHVFGKSKKIKTAADIDTSLTSCWMKDLKDDVKLKDILIPGSHDAGTYSMAPTTGLNLIGKAAQAQEMDIYNQAKVGSRYFDVRVRAVNNDVVINHGVVNGCKVSVVLNSFLKFIDENPSEIIILDMRGCHGLAAKRIMNLPEMKKIFEKSLTHSMCRDYSSVSMKQLWDLNVNFIVILGYDDEHFYTPDGMHCPWNRETRQSSSVDVLVNQEIEHLVNVPSDKMVNIAPIHMPTAKEFFLNKASPIDWEKENSSKRNAMLLSSDEFRKRANIVSLDALYQNEKFIKELVNINKERLLTK